MKKNIYFLFLITIFLILTMSCETFNSAQGIKTSKEHKRKADISIPFDEYLAERVWRLAGCYFENGHYVQLDANLTESRINFFSDGKFEATTGITNYKGTWKHKKNRTESPFRFQITEKKLVDPSNTIGKAFDKAFEKNLINTDIIEINENEIKFYSKKEELLLSFVRL
ncbi:hypothetical protein E4O03_10535 [Treponema sp. OMZ 792]|uniref:hypothetical protein n=1 Tax=unclassified Treponema TaxID=2638727 RepID=UPI0020A5128B|nr:MULTISPECIES: hypothetical protein [unclassified Treponema]UTC74632.1 hypothetical protein E4O03_10535 [Treponema sp. OMZ 792]UTC77045.1 hypothetical protein E4O04_03100 [Treponema sp. OMZ 799]UTC81029.1 hypothetical protein E4O07_10435 [Treponema sp. OMZ 798]